METGMEVMLERLRGKLNEQLLNCYLDGLRDGARIFQDGVKEILTVLADKDGILSEREKRVYLAVLDKAWKIFEEAFEKWRGDLREGFGQDSAASRTDAVRE